MTTSSGITRREVLKRGAVTGAGLLWVTPSAQAFGMTSAISQDPSGGNQGCTPGFWKNSRHSWVGAQPDDLIGETFFAGSINDTPTCEAGICVERYLNYTLLDALKLNGGGVAALLRHAVAAYLNALHPNVLFYYPSALVADVSCALNTCDPEEIETLKNTLAAANEAGCPLANDSSWYEGD